MDEAERLSNLIGGIYDAALDPALWPVALRKASLFVNGSCSSLFAKDATSKTGANTIVELDVNGDKKADFSIALAGHYALTIDDFYF